jgi:hypothetical protein
MFDASQIEVLTCLEAIRRRPGMYVGGTDSNAMMGLVHGAVGHFLRGHLAGETTSVEIRIEGEGADAHVCVRGDHAEAELLTQRVDGTMLERLFRSLHAPGPRYPCIHGDPWFVATDLPPITALSDQLEVEVCTASDRHRLRGADGQLCGPVERVGPSDDSSMSIRYRADQRIFGDARYDLVALERTLAMVAALHPRLTLVFQGRRLEEGLGLSALHTGELVEPHQPIQARALRELALLELSLGWRREGGPPSVRCFRQDEDTDYDHEMTNGLHDGLLDALRAHIRDDFPASDLRGGWGLGLDAVLHFRPAFSRERRDPSEGLSPYATRAFVRQTTFDAVSAAVAHDPHFQRWLERALNP